MGVCDLPFKVGQQAESRSFQIGFRGAWFRCKIKVFARGKDEVKLEYFDFPDEKVTRTKLYQKSPTNKRKSKQQNLQIMVRPAFPLIYRESQMADLSTISDVAVIVNDAWKVGDLVDWFTDGCYWSGRITKMLEDEKVQIDLFPPPIGEGLSYEACCKELRPSLDWSPIYGWTVPTPLDGDNSHPCAWIFNPVNRGKILSSKVHTKGKERKVFHCIAGASLSSFTSHVSLDSSQPPYKLEEIEKQPLAAIKENELHAPGMDRDSDTAKGDGVGKTSLSYSDSNSHLKVVSNEPGRTTVGKDRFDDDGFPKKMRTDGNILLSLMFSDKIEAAILDLEELVNRVKWMKGILETNTARPPWKFLEHRASCKPK